MKRAPNTKPQPDVIPPELEEPTREESFEFDEPDEWGLGNTWDWVGGD